MYRLECRSVFKTTSLRFEWQDDLLRLIVRIVNENITDSATESAVRRELLSGQYPTYAAMRRRGSKLAMEDCCSIAV